MPALGSRERVNGCFERSRLFRFRGYTNPNTNPNTNTNPNPNANINRSRRSLGFFFGWVFFVGCELRQRKEFVVNHWHASMSGNDENPRHA